MTAIYFDQRWCGADGIGRFATEVRRRLRGIADLPLGGSPVDPWDPLRLAGCLRRVGARALLTPGFNVPLRMKIPVVATIHDLIHVQCRDERTAWKHAYYRYVQRPIVRRSPLTLTVSEYSRQQLAQWYSVPESRIVCVGNGISREFTADGPAVESETAPYFLYVGNTKPHKNLDALLSALAQLDRDARCKLVCRSTAGLRQRLHELGIGAKVDFVSGLSDRELASYYRGAIALVLPSHYEGFGLPLAEAMACGCPVIAANRTSIPEVVGDAGVLFDPDDVEELAAAMTRLLEDGGERQKLTARGLSRVERYRWDRVVTRIRNALTAAGIT